MSRFAFAGLVLLVGTALLAEEPARTWEGTWTNKRFNTSGALKCVATPEKDGAWTGTFSGKFMAESFSYDVTFQAKPGRGQTDLTGTAKVQNQQYEWTGTIKDGKLTGRYRSNGGNNGEFVLKEVVKK